MKGQNLIVENQYGNDKDDQPVFFTQDRIEDVLLQVQTNKLKTLGGHTSGYMLMDCGCTGNVAGEAWVADYVEGLGEEERKNVVVTKCNSDPAQSYGFDWIMR